MRRPRAPTLKQVSVAGLSLALVLSIGAQAWAQGRQTGSVRGSVKDSPDAILSGVSVTVVSAALQGSRSTVTDLNGNYEIIGLPPGPYTASFTLQNFTRVDNQVTVPLGSTVEVNVTMEVGAVAEEVNVAAVLPTPLTSTEISQNIIYDEVQQLPMGRDLFQIAELAPGLTSNTPNDGQIAINGSFAYDNIYLVDGVDINDNLFGYANSLFIEDAVEESQVLTSGISAEYGRFSGGVVNVITKSGGNRFSGSFRANMYKPDWTSRTPFEIEFDNERTGTIADNATYESTLGGPIVHDRLWFFYANRRERQSSDTTFPVSGISYVAAEQNDRNQIKLTGTLTQGHTLAGSYMRNSTGADRPAFPFSIDPVTLVNPKTPNDLWVATYRGAVSSSLFIEGQVSRKAWGVRDRGGTSTNIVDSPFLSVQRGLGHYNAPFFDSADPEDRNNRQITASATYFLPTETGTHSIKGGFEHFQTTRTTANSQTSTGFVFITAYLEDATFAPVLDADGRFIPTFGPIGSSFLLSYFPADAAVHRPEHPVVLRARQLGGERQRVGQPRYPGREGPERCDRRRRRSRHEHCGASAGGRLRPARRRTVHASNHLQPLHRQVQRSAVRRQHQRGRAPDELFGLYIGPAGQGRDFEPGFTPANYVTLAGDFPVQNIFFDDDLKSPRTKAFTVSGGGALGTRGYGKLTYINRRASDFVENFTTVDGGSTTVGRDGVTFGTFSNVIYRNTDALERNYDGLELQSRYRVADNFLIDGTWTVQIRNEGNFEGERTNRAGISSAAFDYPEVTPENRYFPKGQLDDFQRHKIRLWGIYNLDLGTGGVVDIGAIWRYNSGRAYSLRANGVPIPTNPPGTQAALLASAGYVDVPAPRTVYFSEGRGSETFDGYGLLDVAVTYSIPVWDSLSPWIKFELFNALNNDKQIFGDTTVTVVPDSTVDELGIPTGFDPGGQVRGTALGRPLPAVHREPGRAADLPDVVRPHVLAARGESPAAVDRHCIPPTCVAHRSHTAGILPRRALRWTFAASPATGLGATPDVHYGLLDFETPERGDASCGQSIGRSGCGSVACGPDGGKRSSSSSPTRPRTKDADPLLAYTGANVQA